MLDSWILSGRQRANIGYTTCTVADPHLSSASSSIHFFMHIHNVSEPFILLSFKIIRNDLDSQFKKKGFIFLKFSITFSNYKMHMNIFKLTEQR